MSFDTGSAIQELVIIQENANAEKITPTEPPKNLIVEYPPKFNLHELGSKAKNDGGKNTRKPPNAFILFRKKYLDALHRLGQRIPMKNVSGWARDAWNKLPQYQKQEYEEIATRAASLYQEWAPHTPSRQNRSSTKKRDRKRLHKATTPAQPPVTQQPLLVTPDTPLQTPPPFGEPVEEVVYHQSHIVPVPSGIIYPEFVYYYDLSDLSFNNEYFNVNLCNLDLFNYITPEVNTEEIFTYDYFGCPQRE
ncbi:11390_t:CDS:2 [Acaulospora colombiana]|uniref:11390_t:CDS:1 n=1 Tax=Acaulospora colombiana TaxID=27376 RepID=A0ACA9L8I7_9GLOM|nr:11390_t:CDS:2 [Acaulospora colombiana]